MLYTIAAIKIYQLKHPENKIMVVLNTDSLELAEIVRNQSIFPDIKQISRKAELAGDIIAKVEVIKDTYHAVLKKEKWDIIVDLDITSPLRRICDIENVICKYMENEEYDLVCSVVEARRSPYFNMVERKQSEFYGKICESEFTARQQVPKSYELNGSIYAYRPEFLESSIDKTILDYKCGISVMPDFLVLDIDSEKDFVMMEYLHRFYCSRDSGINEIYVIAQNNTN